MGGGHNGVHLLWDQHSDTDTHIHIYMQANAQFLPTQASVHSWLRTQKHTHTHVDRKKCADKYTHGHMLVRMNTVLWGQVVGRYS